MLKTIANIIWFILGGFILALLWFVLGLLLCLTIIGIPFGKQCFKFASLMLAPFGKEITLNFNAHPIMNIIWVLLFGWEMFIAYLGVAVAQAVTIIGIPNAIVAVKTAVLALFPFGAKVK